MSISDEVKASGLFDREWHERRYRDVTLSGIPPLEHFVRIGMKLGRDPGPGFDTAWYLQQAPEAAQGELPPFLHYLRIGRAQGKSCRAPAQPGDRAE